MPDGAGGRTFAQILTSIWADRDFRTLSAAAQRHYFVLISQSNLNYAGVLALTEQRWARYCAELTLAGVQEATGELSERRYVVVDYETQELLVRTFIRNNWLWKQPKMLAVAARQALATSSVDLRLALAEEFRRIRELIPVRDPVDNRIATVDKAAKALLAGREPSPPRGVRQGVERSTGGHQEGSRGRVGAITGTSTSTSNQTHNPNPKTKNRDDQLGGHRPVSNARDETARVDACVTELPNESLNGQLRPPDRCTKHRDPTIDPGPCRGCMKARESAEQWDKDSARQQLIDVRACTWCDTDGWRIDPRHKHRGPITPGIRCDHTPFSIEELEEAAPS